ncbi:MAG: excinuclease ABC subunit UvrA [Chloroflexi bacterium]|nr:excinuclease ABC subunit UvrA [Chloroflexota bacterium]
MPQDKIIVVGAREHNLKNITVEIPRDKLVVITGLSGSGKSSLAFDTIFAEGQRRYVESLSAYARQFLGQLEKPDVDRIDGLSPAVAIDQKGVSHNPRSTVGTVTEVYDYLRLLFARAGTPHCPKCGRLVQKQSAEQIVDAVSAMPEGAKFMILAPLVKDRKGHHQQVFEDARKSGFVRVRVDGQVRDVEEQIELDRYKMHTIEAVVDRLIVKAGKGDEAKEFQTRVTDSVETALRLGGGTIIVNRLDTNDDQLYSEHFACPFDGTNLPEIEPRTFSFNSPHGACPTCQGLGTRMEIDPDLIIPNKSLSVAEGAIAVMEWRSTEEGGGYYWQTLEATARHYNVPLDKPFSTLTEKQAKIVLYGSEGEKVRIHYQTRDGRTANWDTAYEGIINNLKRRYQETTSDYIRQKIEEFMTYSPCDACGGQRLRPEALAVTLDNLNIVQVTEWPVNRVLEWVEGLRGKNGKGGKERKSGEAASASASLSQREAIIAAPILKEIRSRLQFMVDVGLDYLTLSRTAGSLSGGEAQRIRLATQIGSQLMGVLYVLDEPSIGLHQRDNARLIKTLQRMRDLGNTMLVVEHDDETMLSADWIVDLGPGAGANGGYLVAEGTVNDIMKHKSSLTGAYLSGRKKIEVPKTRREGNGKHLTLRGARENNLKDIDVKIPLGKLVCITGVSGSGKSTLLVELVYKSLAQKLHGAHDRPGDFDGLDGVEHVDKIINIDQSPIGRTPRSNPATYTGMFDEIRNLFAEMPESKTRGYKAGRYSFNVKGGRCEACQGQGQIQIEMQFLPDVFVPCEVCHGTRYNRETLQVRYKEKSIAEVLDMSVDEALPFFENFPVLKRKLDTLAAVGLGYIKLGQPATTLSGGEAQRVKLSKELSKRASGHTLYVLDEPSVGLHAADVHNLTDVLQKFADDGHTVLIIEHNMDIIKLADHIIDLGPEGGDRGGFIVAEGTPEEVAKVKESYTGQYLKKHLRNGRK